MHAVWFKKGNTAADGVKYLRSVEWTYFKCKEAVKNSCQNCVVELFTCSEMIAAAVKIFCKRSC